MKRRRFTEEQIIGFLTEAEAGAQPAIGVFRKHGISEQTFYRWKSKYGGMELSEAKRLKALEDKNARLKKLLADTLLDNSLLKEVLAKTSNARFLAGGWAWLIFEKGISQRRACKVVGLHRSMARYRRRKPNDEALRERLKTLAGQHRRYGYLRLHVLLHREGFMLNHKKTYRLYREEGLLVRAKKRKRLSGRERLPLSVPQQRTSAG